MKKLLLIFIILYSVTGFTQHHTMSTLASQNTSPYTLEMEWDDLSEATLVSISHSISYSNDYGVTWNTIIAGSKKTLSRNTVGSGTGRRYRLRTENDITKCVFDDYNGSVRLQGTLVVKGGKTLTDMGSMFQRMVNITTLDLSEMITSSVTNMDVTFSNLDGLTTLDLSMLDVSNVETFEDCFYSTSNITYIDVSTWKPSSATTMEFMFQVCANLEYLELGGWTYNANVNMATMFSGCVDLICLDAINTETATDKTDMFNACNSLEHPTPTEVTDLTDANGANYMNGGTCPE